MTKFQCKRGMQAAVTVSGYHQMSSEEEMASHICSTGAITVAVCATLSHMHDYTGGIKMASTCCSELDHSVLLVGMDAGKNAWIVQNSWGIDWGVSPNGESHARDGVKGGYIFLQYGADACGITRDAVAVESTSRSDQTLNPQAVVLDFERNEISFGAANSIDGSGQRGATSVWSSEFIGALVGSAVGLVVIAGVATGAVWYFHRAEPPTHEPADVKIELNRVDSTDDTESVQHI